LRKEDAKRQKPPRTRIPSGGTDSKVGTSHRREVLSKFFAGLDLNYTGVVIGSKRLRRYGGKSGVPISKMKIFRRLFVVNTNPSLIFPSRR
jgi:hypothetical protein